METIKKFEVGSGVESDIDLTGEGVGDSVVVSQFDPAVQAVHTLEPVDAAKVPAAQLVQLVSPVEVE